jgi:ADP-heptose:LPS heptosyltransferase
VTTLSRVNNAPQPRGALATAAAWQRGSTPKRVLFLADGAEDYRERFAPLVAELKSAHPDCLVTALLYFEGVPRTVPSPLPFDALQLAFDRTELRCELQRAVADLVIVLLRHHPATHDHDLTIFTEANHQLRQETAFLFNNRPALAAFLASGIDQRPELVAHLDRWRRRNREIRFKVGLTSVFASLALPALALARRVLGRSRAGRQRILFLRLDVLGDMVLTLPVLRALRERFPEAEITVMASTRGSALLSGGEGGPLFDRLIIWDSPWHSNPLQLLGLPDLVAALRFMVGQWRLGYDLVLQPVELGAGVLFALLFQARSTVAVVSERLPLAGLLGRFVDRPVTLPGYRIYHIADLPDAVAVESGVAPERIEYYRHRSLQVEAASRDEVAALLAAAGYRAGTPLVLVNVGAGHPRRRWNVAKFAALCDNLGASCFLAVLGGPGEISAAAEVVALSSARVLDLAGQLTLSQLTALCAQADLVVTGDTGVMHLAAALNRPLVAIFGAGLLGFCRPLCDSYRIVRHELGCSGCQDICFAERPAPCLEAIQVDEVIEAARQLLRGPG